MSHVTRDARDENHVGRQKMGWADSEIHGGGLQILTLGEGVSTSPNGSIFRISNPYYYPELICVFFKSEKMHQNATFEHLDFDVPEELKN